MKRVVSSAHTPMVIFHTFCRLGGSILQRTIVSHFHRKATSRMFLLLGIVLLLTAAPGTKSLWAQVTEPIPPPNAANLVVGQFDSLATTLRAKATADECWSGLGQNTRYAFLNLANPIQPCSAGQIPKVNQGYIWGSTQVGNIIYFGTLANGQCIAEGGVSTRPGGPPPYVAGDNAYVNTWACEFGRSPYSPSPLPAQIGDFRPSRFYAYSLVDHSIKDITPKLGGTPPGSVCGPTGTNPLCLDPLWLTLRGVRSVTAYTQPSTGRTYVLIGGPALVQGNNALDFFALDVTSITTPSQITNNKWVGKFQYAGFNDMRRWLSNGGVLYAPVGKPNNA